VDWPPFIDLKSRARAPCGQMSIPRTHGGGWFCQMPALPPTSAPRLFFLGQPSVPYYRAAKHDPSIATPPRPGILLPSLVCAFLLSLFSEPPSYMLSSDIVILLLRGLFCPVMTALLVQRRRALYGLWYIRAPCLPPLARPKSLKTLTRDDVPFP